MKKERIINKVPESVLSELKTLVGSTADQILIAGNFSISGSYDPEEKTVKQYVGNELNLVLKTQKEKVVFSCSTSLHGKEAYGNYDNIHTQVYRYPLEDKAPFIVEQKILLKNRGIFHLNFLTKFNISCIDVYGVEVEKNIDFDPDFPEEKTEISADIDLVFKFNTGNNFFFTWYAKEGKMILSFYENDKEFNDFLNDTKKHWGELQTLKYKYSIGK